MRGSPAILLRDVRKRSGSTAAAESFDPEFPGESPHGLPGPNGSGKTTTIRMVLGTRVPDAGHVELFGGDPRPEARRRIGYLPEERGLHRRMRVVDQLTFFGQIRRLTRADARIRAEARLSHFGLEDRGGPDGGVNPRLRPRRSGGGPGAARPGRSGPCGRPPRSSAPR